MLADVIVQGRSGESAALVVSGEPGVGKTALLNGLVRVGHDFLVVRTEGSSQSFNWVMRHSTASCSRLSTKSAGCRHRSVTLSKPLSA